MKRIDIEKIRKMARDKDVSLISTDYKNRKTHLIFKCVSHGEYNQSYGSFSQGHGCPKCGLEKGARAQSLTIDYVRDEVKKLAGYDLISTSYLHAHKKLNMLCPIHGEISMNYSNFQQGKRCKKCSNVKIARDQKTSFASIQELYASRNLSVKEEDWVRLKGVKSRLLAECPVHGKVLTTPDRLIHSVYGCPKCSKGKSIYQNEISDFIESLGVKTLKNDRSLIGKKEIDILMPELNIGIEYCGLWCHSEKFKKNNRSHVEKMRLCNKVGIRLITIFGDEWDEKKDQVKGYLTSVLSTSDKIYARKCETREIVSTDATEYLNKHHIQGSGRFMKSWGLFYKEELVGVITASKHHRLKNNDIVLSRLCFGKSSIVGGASKLFSQLKKWAQDNKYSRIVSWSDSRWSEGNVYKKLGFDLDANNPMDYSYIRRDLRFSKQSCTKKALLKKGAVGNTEKEMAASLGMYRIWDCGKIRWVCLL